MDDDDRSVEDRLADIESTVDEIRHQTRGDRASDFIALAAIVWSVIAGIWLYRHW